MGLPEFICEASSQARHARCPDDDLLSGNHPASSGQSLTHHFSPGLRSSQTPSHSTRPSKEPCACRPISPRAVGCPSATALISCICMGASSAVCVHRAPYTGLMSLVQRCVRYRPSGAFWELGIVRNIEKNDDTCREVVEEGYGIRPGTLWCYVLTLG